MKKVVKPKNAPDPWFTILGVSEWDYEWDSYMVY